MQPRWLIAQLEEFSFLSQSQSVLSDEVRKVLTLTESHGVEHTNRLDSDVHRFAVLYAELMDEQRIRWDRHERNYQQTARTLDEREKELTQAQLDLESTKKSHSFWQNQLAQAQNWKSRAHKRVTSAEYDLDQAERKTRAAESDYRSAKSNYDYARSQMIQVYVGKDSRGNAQYEYRRNPATAELHALNAASSRLDSARSQEQVARQELSAAREEYSRASHQVEGSMSAVADMEVAKKHSYSALSSAEDAKTNTLNARYSLDEERRVLEQMDDILNSIESCVFSQQNCQRELHQHNSVANTALRNNEQIQEDLVYEIYKVRYALENKANLLAAFDAPVFLG
ncbi:hypothetical protein BIY21_19345 [Vibrio ponticus]|uniref:Uncharacterized protein n=1 Tax=Vibrio ponticus TaxID=265668 RepID=A0ABX3F9K7_9VIBR|nr:hypothetical protein [Vibrio ponticus]OLQ85147.1 hypothetical protein BIY21_19345 [Vibrio ponticus]